MGSCRPDADGGGKWKGPSPPTFRITLNRLIDEEVGEDVGQMLPGGVDAGWVATPAVNDL
jgi:DNA invertase Pin-like site-specific DNA recombinase